MQGERFRRIARGPGSDGKDDVKTHVFMSTFRNLIADIFFVLRFASRMRSYQNVR